MCASAPAHSDKEQSCTKCLLEHLFGLSFGVYMFKILPVSLRMKSYVFVFQLFYKSRVSLLYIIYSLILVAVFQFQD